MKISVQNVVTTLEKFAPLCLQESYDNAGLQVGDKNSILSGILIVLDVTEDTINEAIEKNCNMIVAHHPLLFKGVKSITGSTYVERCLIKAINSKISIYAGHTNVDSVFNGVSHKMAEKLQLENCHFLYKKQNSEGKTPSSGLGIIGYLPKELSENMFFNLLKKQFKVAALKHSPKLDKPIRKVALCGGSGSSFIPFALKNQADAYVTGDIGYHQFFDHNNQTILIDIGHFESEQFTRNLFHELLLKEYGKEIPLIISSSEQSPMIIY